MNKKIILNDFKNNKLVTIAAVVFMSVSAMMIGVSALLFGSLFTSIDRLMLSAKTPDFLQMHSGEINEEDLYLFSKDNSDVEYLQICKFLNLENGQLSINNHSLSENSQDNGVCIQNRYFDYLLDINNEIIDVNPGEVYVPVCYKNIYKVKIDDDFLIGSYKLTVAGFLRDSQMNSMMASSKRFLVNEMDYEELKSYGEEEYLIEFKLIDDADINAFSTSYSNNNLPANGPTITFSLIRLMNALSDGMMILIILIASVVILCISIICIRYILLTSLEKDKKEIGMLKAIGISNKAINEIYILKFAVLSIVSAVLGIIFGIIISIPMGSQINEMYGMPENMSGIYMISFGGIVTVELIIILSVIRTLSKMRKLSAIQALYGEGRIDKKKNKYLFISIITAVAVLLMLIPLNMASTLGSPKFVTYMGIGDSQIRIDIRQVENVEDKQASLINKLENDSTVSGFVAMKTNAYEATLSNGEKYKLLIENGDHGQFPVTYSEGTYPVKLNEIALSNLNATELNLSIDDTLVIEEKEYKICGIYSDITNGGKTAKACMENDQRQAMWSVVYVNLVNNANIENFINDYKEVGTRVTDIKGYVNETYGNTIETINKAAIFSIIAAGVVLFIVVLLFLRMIIWQQRGECSLKKALGLTSNSIKREYIMKLVIYILAGLTAGIVIAVFPGEALAGSLLGSLGATGFKFIINPVSVFMFVPFVVILIALIAAVISLMEIDNISPHECCMGRE